MKDLPKKVVSKPQGSNLIPDPKLPPTQQDFRETFQWRIFRIMAEFVEGFHFIADFKKTITIFGSTSFPEENMYYKEARKLGKLLAKEGYGVITGGGPGIMEAGNRGAFEAGGESIGINIQLPGGQRMNPYVNKAIGFDHFFTRKVMLSFASRAYVFFPGGFGTLDEFFEMVTLIQTKKLVKPVPIVVIGKAYWEPLFTWIKEEVYGKQKAIKKEDMEIFHLVDSIEDAMKIIKKS
ncbi:MAG: TIGR00730 family Rossman fold protein [Patescibacteria group bacterium]|nr:TIGR00730 family Rossman fold protein [Patescibacteria group bacterium]